MSFLVFKYWLGYKWADLKYLVQSDHSYNEHYFLQKKGYPLDLSCIRTFSEKNMYLKEHYRNSLITLCSDKYYVKEYLRLCDCSEIGKTVYGVYRRVEDIDFDQLPDTFFIRCNHMSGCNFKFSKTMDPKKKKQLLGLLRISLKHNWYHNQREWNYKNIEPLIICEEYLRNKDGSAPIDYKFYCFSGEPKYWMISQGEYEHRVRNHKFSLDGESIDHFFKKTPSLPLAEAKVPGNFAKMVEYVRKLCKPFPHVRVDLYNIEGRIVFGELTFFSDGGAVSVLSKEFEQKIGDWIRLSDYKKDFV